MILIVHAGNLEQKTKKNNMKHSHLTNVGIVRNNNEDAVWSGSNEWGNYIGIVCDGLGGYKGGSAASEILINTFKDKFLVTNFNQLSKHEISLWVDNVIIKAREEISKYILDNSAKDLANMASTLVCAIIIGQKVYIFNVGDSRAYKISKEKSYQITSDQNLYNYLVKNNKPQEKFIEHKDNLYAIVQFIGGISMKKIIPDIFETTLKEDEYIILTSDGVHNFVTIRDFIDSLINEEDYDKKCSSILSKAIANRSNDNLSVVIIGG